ncbi:hypothetical protein [Streptomyces sp. NPDC050560]|uniref:hypothetical protein n=1 Tax=Streptomyces sp. NPDC050560 TaxID=3365630 RepID=UPI00379F024E
MPTDEARQGDLPEDATGAKGPAATARGGPRHAAPRKTLLTRLHMPAGKAIALAAMPSAVLMGMGLTPTLAQAKPIPKNPFQDGPCVTQPDDQGQDAEDEKDATNGKDSKDAKDGKAKDGKGGKKDGQDGKPGQSGEGSDDGGSDTGGAGEGPSATPSSGSGGGTSGGDSPSPSATSGSDDGKDGKKDPLGGLGDVLGDIGDGLGSILGGGKKSGSPSPSATPSDGATATPSPDASKDAGSDGLLGGAKDTVDKITGQDDDGKGADDDKSSPSTSPSPGASDSAKPDDENAENTDDADDADGKIPFPCVEEKKVAGTDETPPATVPNQPWYLESSSLTLYGMHYKGVVNLTMPNGESKQALKFTASGVDIGDLHQIVDGPGGKKYHVQAAKGSTSTIRDGEVTLYTEKLQGNLFGLIPVTFDPEHPPPPVDLPVPYYFTNVKITQAGQFGGNLTIPGLHQYIT